MCMTPQHPIIKSEVVTTPNLQDCRPIQTKSSKDLSKQKAYRTNFDSARAKRFSLSLGLLIIKCFILSTCIYVLEKVQIEVGYIDPLLSF